MVQNKCVDWFVKYIRFKSFGERSSMIFNIIQKRLYQRDDYKNLKMRKMKGFSH